MLKGFFVCAILFVFVSCTHKEKTENTSVKLEEETIKTVDFDGLEPYLKAGDDKIYVVNFWATWCAPCVKELPYFQELDSIYSDDELKLTLVSLDFPDKLQSKLIPFAKKYNITNKVVLLDAPNENEWIPKIDENWSGAIPATLIFNKDKRVFFEQSFTREALLGEVAKFIKNTKI